MLNRVLWGNQIISIAGLIDEDKLAQCSKLVSVAPKWPNYALLYLDRLQLCKNNERISICMGKLV